MRDLTTLPLKQPRAFHGKDKIGRPAGKLEVSNSMNVINFTLVL